MSSCERCAHFDTPPLGYPCYECFDFNMWEEKRLVTNAERIRSMSDEELAAHFAGMAADTRGGVVYSDDEARWLDWLQMPWNGKE